MNCSIDLKKFPNSRPLVSNFKRFSRSLEHFFLIVGQDNFVNKIPFSQYFLSFLHQLGLHDCHIDANCLNIDGSFECKCKKGFVGDGHLSCERTCYEDCVHGKVQCISDLLTLEGIETIPIMAMMVVEFQVRDTKLKERM